tara:strand:- start:8388 stop:8825 length:438 start_codon:yes stop_codon:yes gene_type:complete
MDIAIEEAKIALQSGEVPVGAIIIDDSGEIISRAHNLTNSSYDPTGHAEIIAIRFAAMKLSNNILSNCDMYVTLEPCIMCAAAISNARIRRLYFGAQDTKNGSVESHFNYYNSPLCVHKPEIYGGISERETKEIISTFFNNKRNR